MIVPRHWAEFRVQSRVAGRQITVRRFGWSNESLDDAERNAEARAHEALARIQRGESLDRREQKVPYNGADGLPIREEILSEHNDVVITRNSYGAHCLNTPDVLIADVDFVSRGTDPADLAATATMAVVGLLVGGLVVGSWVLGGVLALMGAGVGEASLRRLRRARAALDGGDVAHVMKRVDAFIESHRDWHLRVYETPAGMRLIVAHTTFDPTSDVVTSFFQNMHVDRTYAFMCQRQRCFRARLTAKPWRMGIVTHMKPRPGVWPVAFERRAERAAWIATYESTSTAFASCKFLCAKGSDVVDEKAGRVITLHDDACRALGDLPIA